jgi:hypothetical protein
MTLTTGSPCPARQGARQGEGRGHLPVPTYT